LLFIAIVGHFEHDFDKIQKSFIGAALYVVPAARARACANRGTGVEENEEEGRRIRMR
jgi:hypothetical protein